MSSTPELQVCFAGHTPPKLGFSSDEARQAERVPRFQCFSACHVLAIGSLHVNRKAFVRERRQEKKPFKKQSCFGRA